MNWKSISLLCMMAVGTFTSSLLGQEVPTMQKPLFTKITATWCPNCGTWGWTYMKNVIEENGDDALIIGAHHSGDLTSPSGGFLEDNFGTFSQPRFIFGNTDQGVTRSNIGDKAVETKNLVQAAIRKEARIGVGIDASIAGDEVVVKTNTKAFEALDGEFYLALYIVEDKVIAVQSSVGPNAEHPFVIRTSFSAEQFGTQIFNGSVANFEEVKEHKISLAPTWNADNLYVYGIIWQKEGDIYRFENGNRVKASQGTTSQVDYGLLNDVQVFPTISSGQYSIEAKDEILVDLEIDVRDLGGQKVPFHKQNALGRLQFDLGGAAPGYYLIHLNHKKVRRTYRVLVQ